MEPTTIQTTLQVFGYVVGFIAVYGSVVVFGICHGLSIAGDTGTTCDGCQHRDVCAH
jgi:hypothetical protein